MKPSRHNICSPGNTDGTGQLLLFDVIPNEQATVNNIESRTEETRDPEEHLEDKLPSPADDHWERENTRFPGTF